MKKNRGLTFIEMIVVVAVIAILVAVITPQVSTILAKGRDTQRIADAHAYIAALQSYFDVNRHFPGSVGDPKGTEYANGKIGESGARFDELKTELNEFTNATFPIDPIFESDPNNFFYYYDARRANFINTTGNLITIHVQNLEIKPGNRDSYENPPTIGEGDIAQAEFILLLQDPKN